MASLSTLRYPPPPPLLGAVGPNASSQQVKIHTRGKRTTLVPNLLTCPRAALGPAAPGEQVLAVLPERTLSQYPFPGAERSFYPSPAACLYSTAAALTEGLACAYSVF